MSVTKRQRERQKKDACVQERKKDPEALVEWLFVSHPLPLWHRTQSNSPHSWPHIRLASRDLVSLPQLNAHPHIINNCFVHRSIKGLFIKSPFASSKIPLLSSLLHLRRWQRLAEFPFRFHVCGFSFFFFFSFFQLVKDREGSQRRTESSQNVRKAFETKRKDLWELISLNVRNHRSCPSMAVYLTVIIMPQHRGNNMYCKKEWRVLNLYHGNPC